MTDFTKKTGDYPSLSATDIRVIALTYQLEAQHVGTDHIKTKPDTKVQVCTRSADPSLGVHVAGFYAGDCNKTSNSTAANSLDREGGKANKPTGEEVELHADSSSTQPTNGGKM